MAPPVARHLNGEGLQHQDGHSHILASTVPNMLSYDPAFGFELAVIVREGMRRMYRRTRRRFLLFNPVQRKLRHAGYGRRRATNGLTETEISQGILTGGYCFDAAQTTAEVHLLASGSLMQQAIQAKRCSGKTRV